MDVLIPDGRQFSCLAWYVSSATRWRTPVPMSCLSHSVTADSLGRESTVLGTFAADMEDRRRFGRSLPDDHPEAAALTISVQKVCRFLGVDPDEGWRPHPDAQ